MYIEVRQGVVHDGRRVASTAGTAAGGDVQHNRLLYDEAGCPLARELQIDHVAAIQRTLARDERIDEVGNVGDILDGRFVLPGAGNLGVDGDWQVVLVGLEVAWLQRVLHLEGEGCIAGMGPVGHPADEGAVHAGHVGDAILDRQADLDVQIGLKVVGVERAAQLDVVSRDQGNGLEVLLDALLCDHDIEGLADRVVVVIGCHNRDRIAADRQVIRGAEHTVLEGKARRQARRGQRQGVAIGIVEGIVRDGERDAIALNDIEVVDWHIDFRLSWARDEEGRFRSIVGCTCRRTRAIVADRQLVDLEVIRSSRDLQCVGFIGVEVIDNIDAAIVTILTAAIELIKPNAANVELHPLLGIVDHGA